MKVERKLVGGVFIKLSWPTKY